MKTYEAPEIKITSLLLNTDILNNSENVDGEEGKGEGFLPIVP